MQPYVRYKTNNKKTTLKSIHNITEVYEVYEEKTLRTSSFFEVGKNSDDKGLN